MIALVHLNLVCAILLAAAAPPGQAQPVGPDVMVSVNGGSEADVYRGWPLIVEVSLFHPAASDRNAGRKPILLAAQQGPWSNAIRLVVKDGHGAEVAWPIKLATASPEVLSLTADAPAELVWCLAPEDTAKLADGTYQVLAVLDTLHASAAEAWKGNASGEPVLVHVAAEPAALDAEQESQKHRLLAACFLLRGDTAQATAEVDALLAKQPGNLSALELKGDILSRADKPQEALRSYGQAIDAYLKAYGTAAEPPETLLLKQRELLSQILTVEPRAAAAVPAEARPAEQPMLAEHQLVAETADGHQQRSPFAASAARLVLTWKLSDTAGAGPVEARWIAADTSGAASPDYVVATRQSEPGKTSGQFTLTRPAAGFPAGDYRLELWQSGRLRYTERFKVRE